MRALKILFNHINLCDLVLRLRLNADQSDIVNFVQKGHNVLVTGQAGIGKSEVVKFIIHSLRAVEKNVDVVCASGIATQVYEKSQASTVHSFYGLQTAELSWEKFIDQSLDNNYDSDND